MANRIDWVLDSPFSWLAANPLRGRMETKKRVPDSMPTSEALPQARLIRMGERARDGRILLDGIRQDRVQALLTETTVESVEGFPRWRRLAVR